VNCVGVGRMMMCCKKLAILPKLAGLTGLEFKGGLDLEADSLTNINTLREDYIVPILKLSFS
jgi:hypothetical protein